MKAFQLSPAAKRDLEGIVAWYKSQSPRAGIRILKRLTETCEFLAQNPQVGTKRDDLFPGLRCFSPNRPAHNYVVLFVQGDVGIEIMRVLHANRNWEAIMGPS